MMLPKVERKSGVKTYNDIISWYKSVTMSKGCGGSGRPGKSGGADGSCDGV